MQQNPITNVYIYTYIYIYIYIFTFTYIFWGINSLSHKQPISFWVCSVYVHACDLAWNSPFSLWPCDQVSSVPNHAPNIYVRHELMPFSGSSLILWASKIQRRASIKCQQLQQDSLQEEGSTPGPPRKCKSAGFALEWERGHLPFVVITQKAELPPRGDRRKSMATLCPWRGDRGQQPAWAERAEAQRFALGGSVTSWSLQRIHMFDITITRKYFFLLDPMFEKIKEGRGKCH